MSIALEHDLTVDRYHAMIARGELEEGAPFELLNGKLIRKDRSHAGENPMTVGHEHALAVMKLMILNAKLAKLGLHIRPQQPLTLAPANEPEPDAAIVRGVPTDYADHHPAADETVCVIEVSDSSLRRDRTTKLAIYAAAGLPRYIIVNLADRVVEVYSEPNAARGKYGRSTTLTSGQRVELTALAGKKLAVPVQSILP